jgi:hypothetical protein
VRNVHVGQRAEGGPSITLALVAGRRTDRELSHALSEDPAERLQLVRVEACDGALDLRSLRL